MEEVTIPTQSEQKDKDKPCTIWRKIQIPAHGEQKDEGVVCTIWSMLQSLYKVIRKTKIRIVPYAGSYNPCIQ